MSADSHRRGDAGGARRAGARSRQIDPRGEVRLAFLPRARCAAPRPRRTMLVTHGIHRIVVTTVRSALPGPHLSIMAAML
jgi:hypothetical protein